ncbi:FMN-binding protein [Microbacteriaceae bacterium VKM Ac-2854]|nr:FMN-binding protein [Microbacteriaceae bacterium VKM Ac-2854]
MTTKTPTTVRYAASIVLGVGALASLAACSSAATAESEVTTEATTQATTEATTPATTESSAAAETAASTYADGTYEAEGSYTSPGGNETVGVSITLEGDVVTAVTVTPESENPTGTQYQTKFASGIAAVVVGKDIDDLDVSKVSGSSLTSTGFNDAVETIKADAAA